MRFSILPIVACLASPLVPAEAQQVTVVLPPASGRPAGRGFSGFAATPISATAVLHSRMDAADSGAVLGFAVAIRGRAGWYNARTRYGDILRDSLPSGVVGQWWEVGERRYRLVYDPARMTLALFDTTISLAQSRVVLVTLTAQAGDRARVESGAPISLAMSEPTSFSAIFLPRVPEVRAFAGLTRP